MTQSIYLKNVCLRGHFKSLFHNMHTYGIMPPISLVYLDYFKELRN